MVRRLAFISASAMVIQDSTGPSMALGSRHVKDSPSELVMLPMARLPRTKPKSLTLSKSLSRCTRIEVGSDEPSTLSSSSSLMKKKRAKALRFVLRYSLSDFWQLSSFSPSFCSVSRRPGSQHASTTFGFLAVAAMMVLKSLSMAPKRLASSGSCWRMSSLWKMPSR